MKSGIKVSAYGWSNGLVEKSFIARSISLHTGGKAIRITDKQMKAGEIAFGGGALERVDGYGAWWHYDDLSAYVAIELTTAAEFGL